MPRFTLAAVLLLASVAGHALCQTGEKVALIASPEVVEGVLGDLGISYKKSSGDKEGVHFYDFDRDGFKVRLSNFNGKDLWLSALFPRTSLDAVNGWNQKAKFSRAVQFLDKDVERVSIESQIDCAPGVTAGIIRQFVRRFDLELRQYAKTQGS